MLVRKLHLVLFAVLLLAAGSSSGDEAFFENFMDNYEVLGQDLLNKTGEVADVEDFTFTKDVATFTLKKGEMHFQRYVNNRPTTAIFIGEGSAQIDVPLHTARQGLWAVAKDSVVEEDFEVLFIHMADNLDLKLKERFTFTEETLDWRGMTKAKGEAQGEFYFRPTIEHKYDNYFRLLMSAYQRDEDGFFWCDFDRYTFTFDPNWPEEVQIGYEFEGGDQVATVAASFRRQELGLYDDTLTSRVAYPTTALGKSGNLTLSGTDGRRIDEANVTIDLLVNSDSLRFTWLNLQFNLDVDSIFLEGEKINFHRRRSFEYTGIILPKYYYRGDTLSFTVWYRGKDFDHFLPYVSDPRACPIELTFRAREDYNYYMPGQGAKEDVGNGFAQFTSAFPAPLNEFYFHCYPGGVNDTIEILSDPGIPLNFVIADSYSRRQKCFVPHERYRESITAAFNLFASYFGGPPQTFGEYVIPDGFLSAPGVIKVPQVACVTEGDWQAVGGFDILAGDGVAQQWFGALCKPASHREDWLHYAVPPFLGLLHIESHRSSSEYFASLQVREDSLLTQLQMGQEIPLAAGYRVNAFWDENGNSDFYRTILTNKGMWMLHMLRFLMFDYETGSAGKFIAFMRELYFTVINKPTSNADIINLAEKHYGESLDWFFDRWLYGVYMPEFKVQWTTSSNEGKWYVTGDVRTEKVPPSFRMPVIMRVIDGSGNDVFSREWIEGNQSKFQIGPFDSEPEDFFFAEFMSVLGKKDVSRR